jgi:S1-C subfamily serine protease
VVAILAATGTSYAETISSDHRDALERGCHQQAGADHIAYYNCLTVTLGLVNRRTLVDLASMTAAQRDRLRLSCLGSKNLGLIAYDDCLRRQGRETSVEPPARPADAPPDIPRRTSGQPLNAEQLFALASSSVYFVVSAGSGARQVSFGSAVAVSSTRLLTNCHVVGQLDTVLISDGSATPWQAVLRYADRAGDRCVLESARTVKPVGEIGGYSALEVGERVYTIGNPSGLMRTLGEGLISGLRLRDGLRLVQTSAAISPGSSGGGLFDSRGRLIGITTFLLAGHDTLAFAIAADEFMSLPIFSR